ncbi:MAG: phosphatase PAP2 family protein [Prevotella sp.]
MDQLMVALTSGFTWIPLYLALICMVVKNNETMPQIVLAIGASVLCVVLADVMADLIMKPLLGRFRPSNDPSIKYAVHVVNGIRGGEYGFFSAHAANTMSLAVFLALLVRNRTLSITLIVWSLVNCYTRMYLGLHYPLDILCGLLWGISVGLIVYWFFYLKIYRRISTKITYVSTQYTSTGYSLLDIYMVLNILALTFIAALIYSLI